MRPKDRIPFYCPFCKREMRLRYSFQQHLITWHEIDRVKAEDVANTEWLKWHGKK